MTLTADPLYDPHGVDVERGRRMPGADGMLMIAAGALSEQLTDAIFTVADALPDSELEQEGWVRVR
jgi:hypothetical protein